jgi:ankyrin repeat protein
MALHRSVEVVHQLLACKANPDLVSTDDIKKTALHVACSSGHRSCADALLEGGAHLELCTEYVQGGAGTMRMRTLRV